MSSTKRYIAPELLSELESASGEVRALFTLRLGERRGRNGHQLQDRIDGLLKRVERRTGTAPHGCQVYEGLGAFTVQASTQFIRILLEQTEIVCAVPSSEQGSAYIEPRDGREPEPGEGEEPLRGS